jgi:hypothetical protein
MVVISVMVVLAILRHLSIVKGKNVDQNLNKNAECLYFEQKF